MKREIPILIVGITGTLMLLQYFFAPFYQHVFQAMLPKGSTLDFFATSQDWVIVIGILALPLGIWSLLKSNVQKLKIKGERFYSAVLLFGFLAMLITGYRRQSLENGSTFMMIFTTVLVPIQATIFSLLAFFVASAAYRAFRARSVLATILLLTAFLVMLRFIPLGPISTANLSIVSWILSVPNMAAKRAIMMGIGLGATATAIKIILGIERTYMGRD